MNILGKLFGSEHNMQAIKLEVEGREPINEPDLATVVDAVKALSRPSPTFLILTHRDGDYLQVVGARPWCRVERRQIKPLAHDCAFQNTPSPKYNDGAKLYSGVGEIVMAYDEWFLLKDAADIIAAFFKREAFPPQVQWRSMNEMFGI